jgi:hypothetical protein
VTGDYTAGPRSVAPIENEIVSVPHPSDRAQRAVSLNPPRAPKQRSVAQLMPDDGKVYIASSVRVGRRCAVLVSSTGRSAMG